MGRINVLDKHMAELIAAGEVVERPASAIKEMVENSIDAGSTAITVEIKNGGVSFMRVADNGSGIMRDDVKKAFLRHATSKIKDQSDLDKIGTLGFRGEALASISAVSDLTLITRCPEDFVGTSYRVRGGEEVLFEDVGCPVGTTFIVRELFFNVPARMKFLKKDISEGNAVSAVMDRLALAHPEIAFTYIKDGKVALKTTGDGKLRSAIYSVFGREFVNTLMPVDYTLDNVRVYGFISRPVNARPNRNMQNFFINGRYVKTKTGVVALEEACKGSVMVGKFPACVLNIQLDFSMVDVNVHPAKIEVRFVNEKPVFDAVYHGVKSALLKEDTNKSAVINSLQKSSFEPQTPKVNPFEMAQMIFKKRDLEEAEKNEPPKAEEKTDPISELDSVSENIKPLSLEEKPFKEAEKTSEYNSSDIFKNKTEEDISITFEEKEEKKEDKKSLSENDGDSIKKVTPSDEYIKALKEKIITNFKDHGNFSSNKNQRDLNDSAGINENAHVYAKLNKEVFKDNDVTSETVQKPKEENFTGENLLEKDEQTVLPRFIGELFNTYIILENEKKEMLLIDKHAAHERILYEKLKKEKGKGFSQMLLEPVRVLLDKMDYDSSIAHLDVFKEAGFDVEDFGFGTLIVRSAPQYLDEKDIHDSVIEMAGYIAKNKKDITTEHMDWIYHNVACRAAVKGGNLNSSAELMEIVKILHENPQLRYCPHGRPIVVSISKREIEKQFGRV